MGSTNYKLRFWGVRGTVPTPSADRLGYGGNTPCAAVQLADDEYLILDCGSGVRLLGSEVEKRRARQATRFHIFLSHYHLDHVEGMALFPPLYDSANTITFHSFAPEGRTIRGVLEALVSPPYFPVPLSGAPATVKFEEVGRESVRIGNVVVDSLPLRHPDGCVAYRLEHAGRRIVYATDHEHGDPETDRALVEFTKDAEYLIYDATYMQAEYEALRRGWGHSTWYAAVQIARAARVRHLVLFHHHPEHTDTQLAEVERVAQEEFPTTFAAREGMELEF
jgi:phosphoribosyl 1,2-cyclic phosphodiesterase